MIWILLMFTLSLGLTLLIELAVARCFGLKSRDDRILVILVNVLTNPAAVWLHGFWGVPQVPIELLVVIIEYYVYYHFRIPRPLGLSLTANGISWGLGLLIQLL